MSALAYSESTHLREALPRKALQVLARPFAGASSRSDFRSILVLLLWALAIKRPRFVLIIEKSSVGGPHDSSLRSSSGFGAVRRRSSAARANRVRPVAGRSDYPACPFGWRGRAGGECAGSARPQALDPALLANKLGKTAVNLPRILLSLSVSVSFAVLSGCNGGLSGGAGGGGGGELHPGHKFQ